MEVLRARLIMTKVVAANEFKPDNSNLSPFMQRWTFGDAKQMAAPPTFVAMRFNTLLS
jgi:hypothetical protein